MESPDQDFLDEYKPLHVPHRYDADASLQDNVIYALAQLEYATAPEVAAKLNELDPQATSTEHQNQAREILERLFNKGLIKGDDEAERQYNLSKILTPNSGKADS